ncbi:MAG TPA: hypothetical protein VGZ47_08585 [Gemmataceae bacterium]|jgi:hypothetical protein|nr:hypothetical protein [Gemmataceae bacterium]
MTYTCPFVFAAALTAFLASGALANDAEKTSMYPSVNVLTFFGNEEQRAELKITPDQQRSLDGSADRRDKLWRENCLALGKIVNSNLPEREKNAKLRALENQVVDDLFKVYAETLWPKQMKRMKQIMLQFRGMAIFDYPEIQKALKIGDREVKELHSAWDKWASETMAQLQADVAAKKITNQEASWKAGAYARSVPEKVRESLSKQQKRVLEDLLGDKFSYKK